jgi:hypothetical protein
MTNAVLSFSDLCGRVLGIVILAGLLLCGHATTADAAGWPTTTGSFKSPDQVIGKMETFVDDGAMSSRNVVYGLGGLGAVGLGTLALFGRFNWTWLFSLFGGLSLVTLYNVGLQSFTGQSIN